MSITLAKKKSFNDWIPIEDGVRLKIDYPSMDQEPELDDVLLDYSGDKMPKKNLKRYRDLYIRYTIKDWEGIKSEDGTPVECKIVNNMLDFEQWRNLISDAKTASIIFAKIQEQLENTESDKKK